MEKRNSWTSEIARPALWKRGPCWGDECSQQRKGVLSSYVGKKNTTKQTITAKEVKNLSPQVTPLEVRQSDDDIYHSS